MVGFLYVVGVIVILFGVVGGIMTGQQNVGAGVISALSSVVGGAIVMGLGAVLESVRNMEAKVLDRKWTVAEKIRYADQYFFRCDEIELYESRDRYPFLTLNGHDYTRSAMFREYITYKGDEYHYTFPNRDKIVLKRHGHYVEDCDLFEDSGMMFVRLEALGFKPNIGEETIQLQLEHFL